MKIIAKDIKKTFIHIFGGKVLTENLFVNNLRFIILIIFIIIVFINQRYSILQKITEQQSLKAELFDVKYESLAISAELTKISKKSEVEKMIQERGLEVKTSNDPVYKIKKGVASDATKETK